MYSIILYDISLSPTEKLKRVFFIFIFILLFFTISPSRRKKKIGKNSN